MGELIIDYESDKKSGWFQNKIQGLENRYFRNKRKLAWNYHIRRYPVKLDFSKIPKDSIPILVNNFNRLTLLEQQLDWLMSLKGKISIIIIDNLSTYPPLLDFYKNLNFANTQVILLGFNSWILGAEHISKQLSDFEKYIITDSDLLPYPKTPADVLLYLSDLMDLYPSFNHIGLSLEINDLPIESPIKDKVIRHESQYWAPLTEKLNDEVFVAPVDSTFAMYRNTSTIFAHQPALRTDRPYTLKHMDWYRTSENYSEEYIFYLKNCKSFATWATQLKKLG